MWKEERNQGKVKKYWGWKKKKIKGKIRRKNEGISVEVKLWEEAQEVRKAEGGATGLLGFVACGAIWVVHGC